MTDKCIVCKKPLKDSEMARSPCEACDDCLKQRGRGELTLQWVKAVVKAINKIKDDDESAHALEDDLHQAVLHAVADGHPDSAAIAKEALKTLAIPFSRWCA